MSDNNELYAPSPITHKRNRTISQSEKALQLPVSHGKIISFCRNKGHGFIKSEEEIEPIFLHIFELYYYFNIIIYLYFLIQY